MAGNVIEVWGDGEQKRSYCDIDDCVEGIWRSMQSDYSEHLNLGTDRPVSSNELADLVAAAAGKTIRKRYDPDKLQGVRGRNSDDTRLQEVLSWEPRTPLEIGLAQTYEWIAGQMRKFSAIPALDLEQYGLTKSS